MHILGLKSWLRQKKRMRKPTEIKKKNIGEHNLTNRKWKMFKINECWVTDVKYIKLKNQWTYLSILKDVATGFIVGWFLSKNNDLRLYIETWKTAEKYRQLKTKMIVHSDNGSQYTAEWMWNYAKNIIF